MRKILAIFLLFIGISHASDEILLEAANAYAITTKGVEDSSHLAQNARAVLIFPSVKKAGFIVGGMYGSGVAMLRSGDGWSVVEASISNGSIGFQIGYEDNYMVLFVMNDKTLNSMLKSSINLGADATVSIYKASASAGAVDVFDSDIYAYVDKAGAFAGVSLGGFVVNINSSAAFNSQTYAFNNLVDIVTRGY